jgi:RimJ/RimL family protein N-acetyltransferase
VTTDWFERATLRGPTLTLTPLTVADAADYGAAVGEPPEADELFRYLRLAPPAEVADAVRIITDIESDGDRLAYAQRLHATGEFVGTTSFYEISPQWRSIAIGHTWVARRHWRTQVNTESKLIMLTRAFEGLGAERVVWHTDILNLRSQQAIERLGAQREGVLRHHRLRLDGSWRDTVQFSMLAGEWPAVRARLTARIERFESQ